MCPLWKLFKCAINGPSWPHIMHDMVVNVWRALWYNNIHFLLPKCMLVQVKLLYNILSETKYTMHLFQLCPLCACRLLPTRCWCCWKTAIRLNNTRQQLCYMYILYIYFLHIICIYIWLYMYVCCRIKFDLIWFDLNLIKVRYCDKSLNFHILFCLNIEMAFCRG